MLPRRHCLKALHTTKQKQSHGCANQAKRCFPELSWDSGAVCLPGVVFRVPEHESRRGLFLQFADIQEVVFEHFLERRVRRTDCKPDPGHPPLLDVEELVFICRRGADRRLNSSVACRRGAGTRLMYEGHVSAWRWQEVEYEGHVSAWRWQTD